MKLKASLLVALAIVGLCRARPGDFFDEPGDFDGDFTGNFSDFQGPSDGIPVDAGFMDGPMGRHGGGPMGDGLRGPHLPPFNSSDLYNCTGDCTPANFPNCTDTCSVVLHGNPNVTDFPGHRPGRPQVSNCTGSCTDITWPVCDGACTLTANATSLPSPPLDFNGTLPEQPPPQMFQLSSCDGNCTTDNFPICVGSCVAQGNTTLPFGGDNTNGLNNSDLIPPMVI